MYIKCYFLFSYFIAYIKSFYVPSTYQEGKSNKKKKQKKSVDSINIIDV
jgi:hypothetical protein